MAQICILIWRSVRSPVVGAALVGALLLFGAAAPARAGSWAYVNLDGTLQKSRGVLANFKDGTGDYRIVFRRSVTKCIPVITPISIARGFIPTETSNPNEIQIFAYRLDTLGLADAAFYVGLLC